MSLSPAEQDQAVRLARKLAGEFDSRQALRFIRAHRDKKWYNDFIDLWEMITDPEFRLAPAALATAAGALAYVVFPADIIPDFIPCIAWLDDLFILGWAMRNLAGELALYREFCLSRQIMRSESRAA